MRTKTKIIVLRSKHLIYTAILAGITLLLIILLCSLNAGHKQSAPVKSANSALDVSADVFTGSPVPSLACVPGIYTSAFQIGGYDLTLELTMDNDGNSDARLLGVTDTFRSMYPLVEDSFENLSAQFREKGTLEQLTYRTDSKYTSLLLLNALRTTLDKARKTD